MSVSARAEAPLTTYADLIWPRRPAGAPAAARALVLLLLGACLLAASAKIRVPGPVPMTLQTLAVLALGAMLGWRLALGSVLVYVAEGALGLQVFANTPPAASGIGYLLGPTGGFLIGFAVAAVVVGVAADRGLTGRPLPFAAVVILADLVILAAGFLWLAFAIRTASGTGLGVPAAWRIGVAPFLLGEAVKAALAALALPALLANLRRLLGR